MSQATLPLFDFTAEVITPSVEIAAYEALWTESGATFKTIADKFRGNIGLTPSKLIDRKIHNIDNIIQEIANVRKEIGYFGAKIYGASDYPKKLRDAKHPVEVLYYQGNWEIAESPCIAIVGARKASEEGKQRTRQLVKHLIQDDFTIVSGLAEGIDTVAHKTAIELGGRTIAVIGTPLNEVYPKFNEELQHHIKENFLLISQVPFKRYAAQNYRVNRLFFPERNVTMSALSLATIIVEASDTSGTLHQARAALHQGRKLFILDSCFKNKNITWPHKFEEKGAIRVKEYEDIREALQK